MLESSLGCFLATIRPISALMMHPQRGQNKSKNKGENKGESDRKGANDFCFLHLKTKYARSKVVLIVILLQSDPGVGQRCILSEDKMKAN